jgi:hypothetical protein
MIDEFLKINRVVGCCGLTLAGHYRIRPATVHPVQHQFFRFTFIGDSGNSMGVILSYSTSEPFTQQNQHRLYAGESGNIGMICSTKGAETHGGSKQGIA